jgi:hypothetical protein
VLAGLGRSAPKLGCGSALDVSLASLALPRTFSSDTPTDNFDGAYWDTPTRTRARVSQ